MDNIIYFSLSYATNFAVLLTTSEQESPWYISLIVSIVSPIFYFLLKYLFDIMITKAKNKNNITDKQAKDLQDRVDDITDDGVVNHSNKEDEK